MILKRNRKPFQGLRLVGVVTQGSSFLATLGLVMKPLWGFSEMTFGNRYKSKIGVHPNTATNLTKADGARPSRAQPRGPCADRVKITSGFRPLHLAAAEDVRAP